MLRTLQFLAVTVTALALVPGGAHLFALPNKIGLAQDDYFVVQGIYRGWALFGLAIVPACLLNLALAAAQRGRGAPSALAFAAALCLTMALAIFFLWTQPANAATANWTEMPDGWESLRRQWEYSHAAGAAMTFAALCATTLSVVLGKRS